MKVLLAAAVAMALLACAHTSNGAMRDPRTMRVFYEAPAQRYVVLGTIVGQDEDLDDLINDLREQAVDMGGDALLMTYKGQGASKAVGTAFWVKAEQELQVTADVIRFVVAPPAVASPSPPAVASPSTPAVASPSAPE